MKISVAVKYLCIAVILAGYGCVSAYGAQQKHSILAGAGYWISTGARDDLKNTLGFEVLYLYNINEKISVQSGIFYIAPSIKGASIPNGTLRLIPIIANVQYTHQITKLSPYASGGLAFFMVNYSLASDTIQAYNELGFDISTTGKSKAGFNVGGGTLIGINKKMSIFIDLRYFICKTTLENSITERITNISHKDSNEISLDSLAISGGFKFDF